MVRHHHNVYKEGSFAGILGALAVAGWYLIRDAIAGHPLYTPSVLGQVVLFGNRDPVTDQVLTSAVIAYTVIHFAAFIAFGLLVTELVHLAINIAVFRFALLMLFVVFEIFFVAFTHIFFASSGGLFPWGTTLVANGLAAIVMAYYLWKRHPALSRALHHEELGGDPDHPDHPFRPHASNHPPPHG